MNHPRSIDLNCDLGEATTPEQLDVEARLMAYVTSVNIACGTHAGNGSLIRRTVQLARAGSVTGQRVDGYLSG